MEAKVRHLWGFSVTWWKVMPMHNAWGEREDCVWLLFIDYQSSSTSQTYTHRHTNLSQQSHLMLRNLSHRSRKQEQREKQESSKLATLLRIEKRNNNKKQNCWHAIFRRHRLLSRRLKDKGGREQRGWCLSQRWALIGILYTCDPTHSQSSFFQLLQDFIGSIFRCS